jgi:hypothetical protein
MNFGGKPLCVANRRSVYNRLTRLFPGVAVGYQKFFYESRVQFGLKTFNDFSDKRPFSGEVIMRVVHSRNINMVVRVFGNPLVMLLST